MDKAHHFSSYKTIIVRAHCKWGEKAACVDVDACMHVCLSVFMGKNDGRSAIITDYMCEHSGIKCIHKR